MAKHLGIFQGDAAEKILEGQKLMEGRFTFDKILPYGRIKKGDEIYLKKPGGEIMGKVTVDNALFYDNLDPETIGKIRREYNQDLDLPKQFWEKKAKSRFCSLIFLKNPRKFLAPVSFKKKDRRPWVVLEGD